MAGRPEFKVTPALRKRVAIASGGGMSHEEIAIGLGISRNTLEKHFEAELSAGAYRRRLEVLDAMHKSAIHGNVAAQKAYLATVPQASAPPVPAEQSETSPAKPLGKKDQAQADSVTAARGTEWADLLPGVSQVQ
jgi:hypothetical protein